MATRVYELTEAPYISVADFKKFYAREYKYEPSDAEIQAVIQLAFTKLNMFVGAKAISQESLNEAQPDPIKRDFFKEAIGRLADYFLDIGIYDQGSHNSFSFGQISASSNNIYEVEYVPRIVRQLIEYSELYTPFVTLDSSIGECSTDVDANNVVDFFDAFITRDDAVKLVDTMKTTLQEEIGVRLHNTLNGTDMSWHVKAPIPLNETITKILTDFDESTNTPKYSLNGELINDLNLATEDFVSQQFKYLDSIKYTTDPVYESKVLVDYIHSATEGGHHFLAVKREDLISHWNLATEIFVLKEIEKRHPTNEEVDEAVSTLMTKHSVNFIKGDMTEDIVSHLITLDKELATEYDHNDSSTLDDIEPLTLISYNDEIYMMFAKNTTSIYLINKYKREIWRHDINTQSENLNGTKVILTIKQTTLAIDYIKNNNNASAPTLVNYESTLLTEVYDRDEIEDGFIPFYTANKTFVGHKTGALETGIVLIDPKIKSADDNGTLLHHPLIEKLSSTDRTSEFLKSLYYFEKNGKMYMKQVKGDIEQLLLSESGLNTVHSILHNNTSFAPIRDTYNKAEIDSKLDGILRLDDLLLNETTLPWTQVPTESQRTTLTAVFKVPKTFYGLNVGKWGSDWAYNPLSLRTEEKVYLYKFNNFGTPQTLIEDIWSLWKKDTDEFPSNWLELTEDQKHDAALKFVNKICGSSYKRSDFEHIGGTVSKLDHISPIKRSDLGKLYEYFVLSQNPPVFPFESNFSTPQKWSDEYGFTKEQFYNHFVKNTIITEHINNIVNTKGVDVSLESFLEWKTPLSDAQIDHIKEGVVSFDTTKYDTYKPLDKFVYDNEVYVVVTRSTDDSNWIIISLFKNIGPIEIRENGDKVLITEYDNTLPSPYNSSGANLNLQYVCSIISWIKHVQEHPISDATPQQINESYHKRFTFLEGHLPTFPIFTTEDGTIYGVNALGYLNDSFAKLHQIEIGEAVYATKKDTYTRPQIDTKIDSIFRTTNPLLSELRLFWESTPSEAQKTALLSTLKIPETYYALEEEGYGGDYVTQPLSLNVGDKINIYKIINFGEKTHVIKDAWSLYKGPGDWNDLTAYQKRATLLAWINDICSSTYVLSNYTKPNGEVEELSHIVHMERSDLALLFKHFETDNDSDVAEEDGIVKTPKLYSEKNHLQKEDFYNLLRGKIENLTKVSIDSFVDWEEQLTDAQIDFIKEDLHAWDQAKFDDYKIFDLFTYNNQVYICSRILGTNIFAMNLLRNQGIVTFNKTINLVAFHDASITTVPAPFNTDLANLSLKYINSLYSWIEDHDNQAISNPTPGSSVFGDWDSRLSYITPEYSNFPTLPVFTNRKGKIFGVKSYNYLKKFFALKTDTYTKAEIDAHLDTKSHTTIESFHGWEEQLTDAQIDFFRAKIPAYDRAKNNEYNLYDLFNDGDDVMIVAYKNSNGSFSALNLMRNDTVFRYNPTETIIVIGTAHISTLPEPFDADKANLNLKYINSLYSWIEDTNNHIISEPDPDDYISANWKNRFNYITPEASNFPTIPVLTDGQGTIFGS